MNEDRARLCEVIDRLLAIELFSEFVEFIDARSKKYALMIRAESESDIRVRQLQGRYSEACEILETINSARDKLRDIKSGAKSKY